MWQGTEFKGPVRQAFPALGLTLDLYLLHWPGIPDLSRRGSRRVAQLIGAAANEIGSNDGSRGHANSGEDRKMLGYHGKEG